MKFLSSIVSFLIFSAALIGYSESRAAWLNNEPVSVTQPDQTVIHCFATGDEFYNWLHDANYFTLIQSADDGYYYYARLVDDELVPTTLRVGQADPQTLGLTPRINISAEQMKARRTKMENELNFALPENRSTKNEGTLNNLVVYIRFSDQNEFTSDTIINFNRFNDHTPGANSMYNYFQEVSYGHLFMPSTFYPASPDSKIRSYQDDHPRGYYMPYNATTNPIGYQESQRTAREHTLLANAINYINQNSPVPQYIDLDFNNDGNVDNVVFIIRGAPTAWSTLLWPHRWSLYSQNAYINGKRVYDFNFQLETSLNSSGVGVLCHEMFHSLGAPDLYRYDNTEIDPVGAWDIMGSDNNPPQHMGAFMKMKYGKWIENIPWITESGTYTINPQQSSQGNAYRIHSQNSSSQYFVIEYRKKEGTFDGSLSKSGMLIYRINPAASGNASGPPDEVYLFRPNGTGTSNGNLNEAVFGATYGRTAFDDMTNPNAYLQNGSPGGVFISQISSIGETMSFKVDFPGEVQAAIEPSVYVACMDDDVKFTDNSTGLPNSWQWSFSPATVTYVEGTNQNSKNPVVKFNAEGDYSVSLTASNSFGPNTVTETNLIHVGSSSGYFSDGFESNTLSIGSWKVENPDNSITWEIFDVSGNGSTKAAGINFRSYYSILQRDRLISMPFDFSGLSSAYLSFQHAYAQNANYLQVSDSLIILASDDCGETWQRLVAFGEDGSGNFATHAPTAATFFPKEADDWCGSGWGAPCNNIDLSAYAGKNNVRIAFETVSFYGNPLVIDNVVISQFVGNQEKRESLQMSLSPNPVNETLNISQKGEAEFTQLRIYNPAGQLQLEQKAEKNMQINTFDWSSGIYIVVLSNQKESIRQKFVVSHQK